MTPAPVRCSRVGAWQKISRRAVIGFERPVLIFRPEFDDSYGKIRWPPHWRRLQKEFAHPLEMADGFSSFFLAGAGEEFEFRE